MNDLMAQVRYAEEAARCAARAQRCLTITLIAQGSSITLAILSIVGNHLGWWT